MDEVNVQAVDFGGELVELVEPPLGGAPVELLPPVGDELLHVREVRPVVPARSGDLTRVARAGQPLLQVHQHGVGHADLEWNHRLLAVSWDLAEHHEEEWQERAHGALESARSLIVDSMLIVDWRLLICRAIESPD